MTNFDARSRHSQIIDEIRAKIVQGDWPPGYQLDRETDLAPQYGVSRMTMNKALAQLVQEGFIVRKKRSGTFVAKARTQSAVLEINVVADEVAALGKRYRWRLLEAETRKLGPSDLRLLGVRRKSLSEKALVLKGVHFADDEPFCLENRAISLAAAPGAATVDFSHDVPGSWLLQSMPWTTARHSVRAINLAGSDARLLDHAVGAACLEILRKTEIGGKWVTFARLLYPGEAYQLTAEFEPRGDGVKSQDGSRD